VGHPSVYNWAVRSLGVSASTFPVTAFIRHLPKCRSHFQSWPALAAGRHFPSASIITEKMALISGTKLGAYEVVSQLGAGGMGEVYRAHDSQLGRDVAVKVLPSSFSRDPDRLRRFEQEARATAALNHPNILAVFQLGTYGGAPYLVSELLEGGTLREQLTSGPLPTRRAIDYAVQIARGLSAAHQKGITHRDLKPENLFVTRDGRIKILDFGLAKLTQSQPDSSDNAPTVSAGTEPGAVLGTVGYMSPEQVRGHWADHRADIFAFGAILYEMLSGRRAFHKSTSPETMSAILNEEPPTVSHLVQNAPPALQRIVQRCLEKIPEHRFQSASDLAFALEALSDSGSTSIVASAAAKPHLSWAWIIVGGICLAVVLVLAAWWALPTAKPAVESVVRLTNDGEPKLGLVGTDGSRIYFTEGPSGSFRSAQVSVNGGPTAPLINKLVNPLIMGLTGDGSTLLVQAGQAGSTPCLVPLPGGEPRCFVDLEVTSASFFPDGRLIYTQGSAVYVAAKDGSGPRKLAEIAPFIPVGPVVSPDGKRITFSGMDAAFSPRTLYEMAADGTGLRQILKGGEDSLPPEICCGIWTQDERYFLFLGRSGGDQSSDFWVFPERTALLRGARVPARLTNGPLYYAPGTLSRDGKQIFAIGRQRRGELVRYDPVSHEFVRYLGGISALNPTFSADGKWVAYTSSPDHALWRSRVDGSDPLQLTYPPLLATSAYISPDGRRVLFSTPEAVAYVVSMNGGTPQKLTENAVVRDWSPDGQLVMFRSVVSGKQPGEKGFTETRIRDLGPGDVSVVPSSEDIFGVFFATQETLVAVTRDLKKFLLFNRKTKERSELASNADTFASWQISGDRRYLYATTGGDDPKALRIRLADHAVDIITSLKSLRRADDWYSGISTGVAPDGSILFTRDTGTQEVYALTVKWP
jgi:eukaryotic-like serine/threonine-protein kinase